MADAQTSRGRSTSIEQLLPLMDELFAQGQQLTLQVTGDSMRPTWRDKRDSVTLARCDRQTLKKGDIVLYRRASGQYVLHRLTAVRADEVDILGDAQRDVEHGVPKTALLAVVSAYTRNGRAISCASAGDRLYSALWRLTRPVRPYIWAVCRRLKKGDAS